MSTLKLKGSSSGYVELTAPATAGNNTITLPTTAGTVAVKDASNNVEVGTGVTIGSPSSNTFTLSTGGSERLRVDSSGNVRVASGSTWATSDGTLQLGFNDSEAYATTYYDNHSITFGAGTSYKNKIRVSGTGADNTITFHVGTTSPNERMRLDSSGRLLVGTSTGPSVGDVAAFARFAVQGNTSSSTGAGILNIQNGSSSASLAGDVGFLTFGANDGSEYAWIRCRKDGTSGNPGSLVFSTTADGASSPTERMRIQNDGHVVIGKAGQTISYQNPGISLLSNGSADFTRASAYLIAVNRKTDDGVLVEFYQDNNLEGTISVSGTTVSYNGAHLSRWSQLPTGAERTEILRGTVLSNIDEMCEWGDEDNEQLNRMKVSDVEGDKNVSGVFQSWDDDDDTYTNDFYCAMTGDFIIRIGAGVTVERGDLLMSAGDGTAKPQGDGFIQDKTIAKVTSTNVSCTYDDGSYCVPCVLMAC